MTKTIKPITPDGWWLPFQVIGIVAIGSVVGTIGEIHPLLIFLKPAKKSGSGSMKTMRQFICICRNYTIFRIISWTRGLVVGEKKTLVACTDKNKAICALRINAHEETMQIDKIPAPFALVATTSFGPRRLELPESVAH